MRALYCGLLSAAWAVPLLLLQLGAAERKMYWGYNVYANGPYRFIGCDSQQGPDLQTLFNGIGEYIEDDIMPEAVKAEESTHGFNAMFSNNSGLDVSRVFDDINKKVSRSSISSRDIQQSLKIVCVNRENKHVKPMSDYCVHSRSNTLSTPGGDIYVCPQFWQLEADYPNSTDCLKVNGAQTRFIQGPGRLPIQKNKMNAILYQLGRKFSPAPVPASDEKWSPNECLRANRSVQMNNGHTYAYFACFVIAGCTTFPQRFEDPLRRRRSTPLPIDPPASPIISPILSRDIPPPSNTTDEAETDVPDETDLGPAFELTVNNLHQQLAEAFPDG